MQGTLICLLHVSCHKTCSRSAEHLRLLISSSLLVSFGKNFSFFFPTALTSCKFCICFNWLWVASAARAISRALFSVKSGTRNKRSLTCCFVEQGHIYQWAPHFPAHAKTINTSRKLYSCKAHNTAQNALELYPF